MGAAIWPHLTSPMELLGYSRHSLVFAFTLMWFSPPGMWTILPPTLLSPLSYSSFVVELNCPLSLWSLLYLEVNIAEVLILSHVSRVGCMLNPTTLLQTPWWILFYIPMLSNKMPCTKQTTAKRLVSKLVECLLILANTDNFPKSIWR